MNRHAIVLLFVGLAALGHFDRIHATNCAVWSETAELPLVHPEIDLHRMAVLGSLLVGTGTNDLHVFEIDEQGVPTLLSTTPLDVFVTRVWVFEGEVYLIPQHAEAWRVDLTDPLAPVLLTVSIPAGELVDLAHFDGGYLVLSSSDSVFVVEDPLATEMNVMASFPMSSPHRVVTDGSMAYVAMDWGVKPVDLADPTAPIIGSSHYLHPIDQWTGWAFCRNIMIRDGILYGQFSYSNQNYSAEYLVSADLEDPMVPELTNWRRTYGVSDSLEIVDGKFVMLDDRSLEFVSIEDLEAETTVFVNNHRPRAGVVAGDHYLVAVPYDGLHRIDLNNCDTVEPELTMPSGYDPAYCGSIGLAVRRSNGWSGHLSDVDWTIYDQTSPATLDSLGAGHVDVYFDDETSCTNSTVLADANDRWVLVKTMTQCSSFDEGWTYGTVAIHDLQTGNLDTVGLWYGGYAYLEGNALWTYTWSPFIPGLLRTYWLTDAGVVPVATREIPGGSFRLYRGDGEFYLVSPSSITVFDSPANLTPVREIQIDQALELYAPAYVEDGLLYAIGGGGSYDRLFAVVDLDPPSSDAPVVIGSCELDISGSQYGLERQGSRVIVFGPDGWQAIDVADPTNPTAISPLVETRTDGLHLSGDLLYLNTGHNLHLYDVSDFTAPRWIGQSTYQYSLRTSPCALDGYVLSASQALPPDCSDVVAVDPGDEELPVDVPTAVTLAPVAPNPFNPSTTITFELRHTEHVTLAVHDLRGRRLATLLDQPCPPGGHRVQWLGRDDKGRELPSGTYLVQLRTESAVRSTKAVLVR